MMALPKCVCGQDKHICIDCIEAEVERLRELITEIHKEAEKSLLPSYGALANISIMIEAFWKEAEE